jgi:hypothetical protein
MQKYELGVDTLFSDISSDAPRARYVATVHNDFLVVANTFDTTDGNRPYRVRWSGIGSSNSWPVSATNQADFQDLDGHYGWINQIITGEYGTIFQEYAITRMDYVGSPTIFQFQTVEVNQGTKYPNSVVRVGNLIYFIGLDGFRVFNGAQSVPIGNNKVNHFFFDDIAAGTGNPESLRSAVDYNNHVIVWGYQSDTLGTAKTINRLLFYNYAENSQNRWGYADFPESSGAGSGLDLIFTALSRGYTLDGLDEYQSVVQSVTPNIDVLPYSLDSRVWTGNNLQIGAFRDSRMAFTGSTYLDAVIETPEVQLTDGQRSDLFLARPAVNKLDADTAGAVTITMQIGTRNQQISDVAWTTSVSADSIGNYNFRSNARYHRARTNISGGFKHAIGVELLEFKPAGWR